MTYKAAVIEVLIASPSDVEQERVFARDVLEEWNIINSRERHVVLMPIGWETHTSPELGGRPQQMINDRLLSHADIVLGIFWTRAGTPTGKSISGSVEEIEIQHLGGKPVMLYFSNASINPSSLDTEQYRKLQDFKSWARPLGLVEEFGSSQEFKDKFRRQLQLSLNNNRELRSIFDYVSEDPRSTQLSASALELLSAAAAKDAGMLQVISGLAGWAVSAGGQNFGERSQREAAKWESALSELKINGLISDKTGTGHIFRITQLGYELIEKKNSQWSG